MYNNSTKVRVEVFLKKKKTVFQTELQYLGNSDMRMQIKLPTLQEILFDLKKEKKIKVEELRMGKRIYKRITWLGK